ncbi:MAG: hypothetical protein KDK62_01670 [Chlamydiia bacterium]|nr:hypothetical protein [Chlamydiia bacterium]
MLGGEDSFYQPMIQGPKDNRPLPLLFYFALSADESLNTPPINEPARLLKDHSVRVVSISLPFHDDKHTPQEAMIAWGKEILKGKDPLKDFLKAAKKTLTDLLEKNLVDPEKIAVSGVSRGALAAGKFFSLDSRIQSFLGWAPLIDFSKLSESQELEPYSLFENLDSFVGRKVKFLIGNHDTRVHTDITYAFVQKLVEASLEKGVKSPPVELALKPSIGYKGHGSSPETFQEGVDWVLKQFNL